MFFFVRAIFHFWNKIFNIPIGEPVPQDEDNREKPDDVHASVIITMEDLDITEMDPAPIDTDGDKLCKFYTIISIFALCFMGLDVIVVILITVYEIFRFFCSIAFAS